MFVGREFKVYKDGTSEKKNVTKEKIKLLMNFGSMVKDWTGHKK